MATGVEIAGLVLGSIPLLIAALEHYEDVIGPTVAMLRYRGELERATRELRDQRSIFQQSVMLLLKPITRNDEMSEMIDNSGSAMWKDKSIEVALKEHLGVAYVTYVDIKQRIEAIIIQIASKLEALSGIESLKTYGLHAIIVQHRPARKNGKAGAFKFSTSIKFTMSRQRIKASLKELSRLIDMLDKIQNKADKMKDIDEGVASHGRSKFAIPLRVIRSNATRLYQVLFRTWCSRYSAHLAGLLLEQRLVRKSKRGSLGWRREGKSIVGKAQTNDAGCFCVSVDRSCSSGKWLDLEIKPMDGDCEPVIPAAAAKVRLVAPDPSTGNQIDRIAHPFGDPTQLQVVTDLCAVLQRSCPGCMGFYMDNRDQLRGNVDTARVVSYIDTGLTLKDLISQHLGQLNLQQRYSLAITLVSSLLQLAQTPWLRDSWSEADIMFIRAPMSKTTSGISGDVERPYLTRKQGEPLVITAASASQSDSSKLLQLAVMLIQIYYGRTLEALRRPNDTAHEGNRTEMENFQVLRQLLAEKKDCGEISHAFFSAISYCHQCYTDGSASLSNDELSRAIETKVLLPLEEEMHMVLFGPEAG